jgi:hypothetical protein
VAVFIGLAGLGFTDLPARLLVLTGGEPGPGDSAESLRLKGLAWGVPAERIRLESVSRGTRESLLAVAPNARELAAARESGPSQAGSGVD